jgi:hypothetical protein
MVCKQDKYLSKFANNLNINLDGFLITFNVYPLKDFFVEKYKNNRKIFLLYGFFKTFFYWLEAF